MLSNRRSGTQASRQEQRWSKQGPSAVARGAWRDLRNLLIDDPVALVVAV